MKLSTILSSLIMAAAPFTALAQRKVFAHYMLGLTSGQTSEQWAKEISDAKALGIDGFALNAGPNNSWSETQMALAYAAAEAQGFTMFISFDQLCCGDWDPALVAKFVNDHKDSPAQFKVDGKPFVSTFEGGAWADKWAGVKASTGPLYLVPNWGNVGPGGIGSKLDIIDGAFSWEAWSKTPSQPKTTQSDIEWMNALGSKAYMMPVSPWFYTNIPTLSTPKNWFWPSDTLWFDRWEQVLKLNPEFVEIITWNDFGESHYITGNVRPKAIHEGAEVYVNNVPHAAWQRLLPYYIQSYKTGARVPITQADAAFWYRQTPAGVCSDGGTTCGQNGGPSAATCTEDAVWVWTLAPASAEFTLSIGGVPTTVRVDAGSRLTKVTFDERQGDVTLDFAGKTAPGPAPVRNVCPDNGRVNFNPVVGGL